MYSKYNFWLHELEVQFMILTGMIFIFLLLIMCYRSNKTIK